MKKVLLLLCLFFIYSSNAQTKIPKPKKIVCPEVPIKKVLDENSIYDNSKVDVKPEYDKGFEELNCFIRKNFLLPQEIIDKKINKTLAAMFVVQKDGTLSDIKVIRDIGYGTGKELIRVIRMMPKWKPAQVNGKNVKCNYTLLYRINAK